MATETTILENEIVEQKEDEINSEKAEAKLQTMILKYFQNKEIAKERAEENKRLMEDIEHFFNQGQFDEFVTELPNGEFAKLFNKVTIKEVLDKDGLAESLQISKDEIKTPWDFSMLTKQGKLEPKTIAEYTETQTNIKLALNKSKKKPKTKNTH
jgi:hypothetical protein